MKVCYASIRYLYRHVTTTPSIYAGYNWLVILFYVLIRGFQLYLSALYWQKERELLSVKKGNRDIHEIVSK